MMANDDLDINIISREHLSHLCKICLLFYLWQSIRGQRSKQVNIQTLPSVDGWDLQYHDTYVYLDATAWHFWFNLFSLWSGYQFLRAITPFYQCYNYFDMFNHHNIDNLTWHKNHMLLGKVLFIWPLFKGYFIRYA